MTLLPHRPYRALRPYIRTLGLSTSHYEQVTLLSCLCFFLLIH